jgi:hypothetical protein
LIKNPDKSCTCFLILTPKSFLIMKKIILLTAIVMIATTTAVAQSSASDSGKTSAQVITPITISKTVDMNFGNLVATVAGGAIVLATDGSRTGPAAILAGTQNGTIAAASFTVDGETDFTFDITLPSGPFVVSNGDTEAATMSVGSFLSSPNAAGTLALGTETLLVGATITLDANQASGTYTNDDALAVTVNYN